jgi:hypothetical protein
VYAAAVCDDALLPAGEDVAEVKVERQDDARVGAGPSNDVGIREKAHGSGAQMVDFVLSEGRGLSPARPAHSDPA